MNKVAAKDFFYDEPIPAPQFCSLTALLWPHGEVPVPVILDIAHEENQ